MSHPPTLLDDELQALEDELFALRPVAPSEGFRNRLSESLLAAEAESHASPLPEIEVRPAASPWFGWIPLSAAAAVAIAAVVLFPATKPAGSIAQTGTDSQAAPPVVPQVSQVSGTPAQSGLHLEPFSSQSQLQRVDYEGIRRDNNSAYRQIRSRYLENRVYRDPNDGTTVEVYLPREELRLVPVSIE